MARFLMPGDDPEEKKAKVILTTRGGYPDDKGVDWLAYERLIGIPNGANIVVIDNKYYTFAQARRKIIEGIQNWFLLKFANFFNAVSKYTYETRQTVQIQNLYPSNPSQAAKTTFMERAKRMVQILWRRDRRTR